MQSYVRRRGAARDAHKLSHWSEYVDAIDTDFLPVGDHHVIDNSASADPLKSQAEELIAALVNQK